MNDLLKIALSQYGVKEISGEKNNKQIVDYAKEAGFEWVNDDETPWCSIFINWCAMKAGLERSHKANARSWLNTGELTTHPETGDIVIVLDVGYEYLYQFDPVIVVEECYPNSPYNFKHWKYKEIHDEL